MNHAANAPIAKRRIIGLVVSLLLVALTVHFIRVASHHTRRFEQWLKDQPMRVQVDLSRPGVTEAPFIQTCQSAHAEHIILQVDVPPEKRSALLAGLKGSVEVVDGQGKIMDSMDLADMQDLRFSDPPNEASLVLLRSFPLGRYTFRLRVDEPAPALEGHPHWLMARYHLCGLELLPAALANAAACITGLLAAIIGLLTLWGLCRYGWRRPLRAAPADVIPPSASSQP